MAQPAEHEQHHLDRIKILNSVLKFVQIVARQHHQEKKNIYIYSKSEMVSDFGYLCLFHNYNITCARQLSTFLFVGKFKLKTEY